MGFNSKISSKFNTKILENQFWHILTVLDSLNQDVSIKELQHHLGKNVKEEDIFEAIAFLKKFNYPVKTTKKQGHSWLCFTGPKEKFRLDLSLGEWLALQAHLPLFEPYAQKEVNKVLMGRLERLDQSRPEGNLFRAMEGDSHFQNIAEGMDQDQEKILQLVEEAINENYLVTFKTAENNAVEIFPHKIVFLDGVLSLIGEDCNDRCMSCIEFSQLKASHQLKDHSYKANFVAAEVEDFIMAIRSITGNEERLVLRITHPEKINLNPSFHFLGNPYVTTNMDGEFIWAASVETSEELFKWLESIYEDVEILDPQELREQFESYLEGKDEEIPLKKAS